MKALESIRQDIEDLRELILSLDDEIWTRVEHRDNETFAEFAARKPLINERIQTFQTAGNDLLDCMADLPAVQLPVATSPPRPEEETVAPLDRSFAFTKPTAFLFDSTRVGPARSWRVLWQKFLEFYHREHPDAFKQHLKATPCIAGVAETGEKFHDAFECHGTWFECCLSANSIRDRIQKIMLHSRIETSRIKIVLRGNPDLEGTIFES